MRAIVVTVGFALMAVPAWAQTQAQPPGPPVDHGPFTPQANQAYQGGGVILQGAPGAPPPPPAAVLSAPQDPAPVTPPSR